MQVLLVVLDRNNIVAAAFDDVRRDRFLPEDRAGDDLAFPIKPIKEFQRVEFQRVENFEALGPGEAACPSIVGAPPGNAASPCSALPSPSLLARRPVMAAAPSSALILVTWRTPLVIVVGQRWRAEDRLIQGQKSP